MSCYFSMDDMLCLWRLGKLAINVLMNPYVDDPGCGVSHLRGLTYVASVIRLFSLSPSDSLHRQRQTPALGTALELRPRVREPRLSRLLRSPLAYAFKSLPNLALTRPRDTSRQGAGAPGVVAPAAAAAAEHGCCVGRRGSCVSQRRVSSLLHLHLLLLLLLARWACRHSCTVEPCHVLV